MNGNIFDTNVIIRIIKGDIAVANEARKIKQVHIPVIVLGELLFGAEKSQLKAENRDKYLQFCLSYPLLDVTKQVALEYGKIKCALQSHGNIMPENDMWIAATALANDMAVITQDKHFEHIPNLRVIKL
ncbi:MAG: PIN domain-containing protein [Spirochaetaceae bacterium]|nr:PIN domain-containing protein [Spirochaetaceae bacterium]